MVFVSYFGIRYFRQNDVCNWKDIVAISAGAYHTVELKSDGTVVAVGWFLFGHWQCKVKDWKNIAAISADGYHTVGLNKDRTAVAIGYNENSQCNIR